MDLGRSVEMDRTSSQPPESLLGSLSAVVLVTGCTMWAWAWWPAWVVASVS